jgi:hypothetical protein
MVNWYIFGMLYQEKSGNPDFSYEQQEVALNCGAMLRECIRYEALTKILLNSDNLFDFFKYVEVSTFDIASDAFATFKVNLQELVLWNRDFKMPQNSTLLRSDVPALWLGGI